MLKIVKLPNPILRTRAKEIETITPEIKTLAKDMIATLAPKRKKPIGVGLAANQVGRLERIFIMLMPDKTFQAVLNPEILKTSRKTIATLPEENHFLEGCLSIHGYFSLTDRPVKIKVRYRDLSGRKHQRGFSMPHSIYFQHELDHLNGNLFIDHLDHHQPFYLTDKKGRLHEVVNPFIK